MNFNQMPQPSQPQENNSTLKSVAAAAVLAASSFAHAGENVTQSQAPLTPEQVSTQAQEAGDIKLNQRFYDKNGQGYELHLDENGTPVITRFVIPKLEVTDINISSKKGVDIEPQLRTGEQEK